jgi:hypothetical protein
MITTSQTQTKTLSFLKRRKMTYWRGMLTICFLFLSANSIFGQVSFGAYYTKLNEGQSWEAYSRTGNYADIVVQLSNPNGQLVFWRGNSYLPYWKTDKGQWNLQEIIARTGDGTASMPDRTNIYSHAEIIENSVSNIIIHWRYLSKFTAGNPHGDVDPDNFTDEVFTITPNGHVTRVIKQGTNKIDDWNDPLNQITLVLQLSNSGVTEISRTNPGHSDMTSTVKGNPEKGPNVVKPVVWFKFDESQGDDIKESISNTSVTVTGHKTLWKKGVSGTALEFDGYNTVVSLPADKSPNLSSGGVITDSLENTGDITLEGWFVLGAYPWNWAPIVQQGDNTGYFLGIDAHGYPGFMAKVNGWWQELTVSNKPPFKDANHLKLFHWYHIAGVYNIKDGMMRLFINGKEIAKRYAGPGGVETVNTDIRVGKAGIMREPTEGTHDNLPSNYGFDGLIDEVRIYNTALSDKQIAESYNNFNPGTTVVNAPDMQKRAFPYLDTKGKFEGVYTHLPYYETWENLWRFDQYADVVVGFDELPMKYVFWRGVSYIPMMVNESNQWFTNEFNETGFTKTAPGDCEPMSDKGNWDSHARIIENTPARVVVEWRYCLSNPSHQWANYDPTTGWGDISDWLIYIYPDGVVTKKMRCYTSVPDYWYEWDEQIAVFGEGQTPGSFIEKKPVMTLIDSTGKSTDYNWITSAPDPKYKGNFIQKINLTGKYDPFTIQRFTDGDVYKGEVTWYSVTPSWNHWPTAQVNSSGRNASFPDRAAHSSISHLFWDFSSRVLQGNITYNEKNLMEGMTNASASTLVAIANSWLKAPVVSNVSGGTSNGYSRDQRAYQFVINTDKLSFEINASNENPIKNLCFVIKNWGSRTASAKLMVNGKEQTAGPNFRQGVFIDTDGTFTKVIWAGISATETQSFEIIKE